MNTTDHAPALTVSLDGIGDRPALAAELHPVALCAALTMSPPGRPAMPAGTWGVVVWPADTDTPTLAVAGRQSVIIAHRLADLAATANPTDRVYLVRRCPVAVTVHSLTYPHRGHLLGSLPVDANEASRYAGAWHHAMNSASGDNLRDEQHAHNLLETWRRAHGLTAGTSAVDIITAVAAAPRTPLEYLNAYCMVLSGALHADAETTHRAATQHVPAHLLDDRVRAIADQFSARYATTD